MTQRLETGATLLSAPTAIFDRTAAGHVFPPVEIRVDERAIRFFAETLGFPDTAEGAQEAPPTFFTFIDAEADKLRKRRGERTILEVLRADYRYLLHGEESYELVGPILPDDRLVVRSRITDFFDKAGGTLEFARVEQMAEEASRGLLVRAVRLYIHKLAP